MKEVTALTLTLALAVLLSAAGGLVCAHGDGQDALAPVGGPQGYAGPGWAILFGPGGTGEMASLGPVMFRVSENLYLGPLIAYSESASEGPDAFLGGIKVEGYLGRLSRGPYSTSVALSLLAGAAGLNEEAGFAAQLDAELDANLLLFPSFTLAAGPLLSSRLRSERLEVLPGVGFSVKEASSDSRRALLNWGPGGPRVGGYWQGLWTYVNGSPVFVDGGGTRVELPVGLAFGITGGVLRQRVRQGGSDLAIMLSGVSAEWNAHLTPWLTVTPRVVSGLAMYGWVAPDESIEGGPHFMVRPELCAFLGVLPFLQIGGGIGYQFVLGAPTTAIPLGRLSSLALSVQARVGPR
jgi:hypothetical protein